jgi:acetoin:2,6-dichlorophenolindophenol oxidoreductase subunit beta
MTQLNMVQAINEALRLEMRRDESVVLFGQGIRGNLYGSTKGLLDEYGPDRIIDTPISENAIGGIALGMALTGYRPLVETNGGFLCAGFEETIHLPSHWRLTHGGEVSVPMVTLVNAGGRAGLGTDHGTYPTGLLLQYPGLKIAVPSTPADAKGLVTTALRDDDPVFVVKHTSLSGIRGEVPDGEHTVPFGRASVRRAGTDVTIVASAYSTVMALQAAETLEPDVSVEVVDLRTLNPLDESTVLDSVAKTGRAVVVDDDMRRGGIVAELSALIMERAFDSLRAPVARVGRDPVPLPAGMIYEAAVMPSVDSIIDAVRSVATHVEVA